MYKVMVVDDEITIKEWVEDMISSVDAECIVLKHNALNGSEALNIFETDKPDIIFTDIIMPVMDGVELVKELRRRSEMVKIIVLSNYNDFQYVKETLSNGASDYFLKLEIKPADLKKIIGKVKAEIKEQQKKKEEITRLKISINSNQNILKEKYIRDLVTDSNMKNAVEDQLTKAFHLNFTGRKPAVLALKIDNAENELNDWFKQDDELFKYAVINVCEDTINPLPGGIAASLNNNFVIILTLDEKEYNDEHVRYICKCVQKNLFEYMKLKVSFGIDTSEESSEGLERQYQQSLKALEYGYYLNPESICNYRDIDVSGQQQDLSILKGYIKEVLEIFKNKDFEGFLKVLREVSNHVRVCSGLNPRQLKEMLKVLIRGVEASVTGMSSKGMDYSAIYNSLYNAIDSSNYNNQLVAVLEQHVHFLEEVLINDFRRCSPYVRAAVDYIGCNFSSDITRSTVAEHVHLNVSYFSELFSKEMGQSFSDYLIMIRIEAAKELLKSSALSISEISSKVGYPNQSYFAKLFKNITGMTPMQFKEQK